MRRRKKQPMEQVQIADAQAKAKVSIVLQVLSGEKSIAAVCKEAGMNALQYYKLEGKMISAMANAASLPTTRGKKRDPMEAAAELAQQTDQLRQEHRRMQSLLRVSRKLLKTRRRGPRKVKSQERPPQALLPGTHRKPEPVRHEEE